MRTTITLDPDVAVRLHRLARERRSTFKATVNATLRAGLDAEPKVGHAYRESTRSLGAQSGVDLTKGLSLAAELEDDEIRRKLEHRK
jgi:hypothetical protein